MKLIALGLGHFFLSSRFSFFFYNFNFKPVSLPRLCHSFSFTETDSLLYLSSASCIFTLYYSIKICIFVCICPNNHDQTEAQRAPNFGKDIKLTADSKIDYGKLSTEGISGHLVLFGFFI